MKQISSQIRPFCVVCVTSCKWGAIKPWLFFFKSYDIVRINRVWLLVVLNGCID